MVRVNKNIKTDCRSVTRGKLWPPAHQLPRTQYCYLPPLYIGHTELPLNTECDLYIIPSRYWAGYNKYQID